MPESANAQRYITGRIPWRPDECGLIFTTVAGDSCLITPFTDVLVPAFRGRFCIQIVETRAGALMGLPSHKLRYYLDKGYKGLPPTFAILHGVDPLHDPKSTGAIIVDDTFVVLGRKGIDDPGAIKRWWKTN